MALTLAPVDDFVDDPAEDFDDGFDEDIGLSLSSSDVRQAPARTNRLSDD
jgi:hypothetical protein